MLLLIPAPSFHAGTAALDAVMQYHLSPATDTRMYKTIISHLKCSLKDCSSEIQCVHVCCLWMEEPHKNIYTEGHHFLLTQQREVESYRKVYQTLSIEYFEQLVGGCKTSQIGSLFSRQWC